MDDTLLTADDELATPIIDATTDLTIPIHFIPQASCSKDNQGDILTYNSVVSHTSNCYNVPGTHGRQSLNRGEPAISSPTKVPSQVMS